MGLFDGTIKSFAAKLITALQTRATIRRKVAERDPKSAMQHHTVAFALEDVAEVIKTVAEL